MGQRRKGFIPSVRRATRKFFQKPPKEGDERTASERVSEKRRRATQNTAEAAGEEEPGRNDRQSDHGERRGGTVKQLDPVSIAVERLMLLRCGN
ncbi:hypothetical protein TNIN_429871 [Trichonephila inaurata madagascariensis]|uniref:Uncharacterized protein n=1 Tax=Trichonephila inaurata madagascariensis TaxID=2747483 RepID=A0A8X6XGA6_9ARAC|nr:hypothetical protein TNIN_429871 [Trichonephila inaurata madagascariensis]